jgi:hypothetical protein
MSVLKNVRCYEKDFMGAVTYTTSADANGFKLSQVASAGTPVASHISDPTGAVKLLLGATSEAETLALHQGDVLSFDIDQIQHVKFVCQVAGVDAVSSVIFGLAGAHNATADSVAQNVWFKLDGTASTSAVVVETDDGTNDHDDISTGKTLASTYKTFEMSFSKGTSDIRFYIDGQRVANGTTFDMSGYTGQLQPYLRVDKISGTGIPSLTCDYLEIQYKR